MANFVCPQCDHSQVVDDKHLGKTATCPKCKTQAVIKEDAALPGVPTTAFVEAEAQRVVHATAGPLGIRCDTWIDSERHINKSSSLQIDSWTVIDEALPIRFAEPCGLRVHNKANDYPLRLFYQACTILRCCEEPVAAFETRHMTFNVWGEHVSTLRACNVLDVQAGKRIRLNPEWHLYSESEADEFCASLSFVSRVRLTSGAVKVANLDFVLREARRISEKVTEADLETKAPKKT